MGAALQLRMPRHLLGPSLLFALAALAGRSGDTPTVEMVNQPPGAPVASIAPTSPRTDDDLLAVIQQESDDADGNTVTYGYRWFVDGEPRDDLTAETVPASETSKGQVWTLLVTPNDGEEDGETATVETTILNTAPVATVALSPETPTTDDELLATAAATDADGDAVTFSYAWALDAAPQADVTDRGRVGRHRHADGRRGGRHARHGRGGHRQLRAGDALGRDRARGALCHR